MGNVRYTDKVSESMRNMIAPGSSGVGSGRASVGQEARVGEYFFIPVDKLMAFASQARVHFDAKELDELKQSIANHGILQPLHIIKSPTQEGFFEVVSGERRLRAATMLGLERVPCIILKDIERSTEIAIIENIQRSDLHPLELARAYADLLVIKLTQTAVAQSLGISPKAVSETLKLLEIPEDLQKELIEKNIRSRDTLRRIVKEKALPSSVSEKRSVLRISIVHDQLQVQKGGMENLSEMNRRALIGTLYSVLNELEGLG